MVLGSVAGYQLRQFRGVVLSAPAGDCGTDDVAQLQSLVKKKIVMKTKYWMRRIAGAALAIASMLGAQSFVHAQGISGNLTLDNPRVKAVIAVQNTVTTDLMKVPGVLGTAVGVDASGNTALVVYVDQDSPSRAEIVHALPPSSRGVAIKAELTDKFRALKGPPSSGGSGGGTTVSHTAKQTPPIQLGTSGGWFNDLANGYCCGGTLGSLIQVSGSATSDNNGQYILSNYHVFESDIVDGGSYYDPKTATDGFPIIQPGLIDVSCNATNAQSVGTLHKLFALPWNNVDCSVAKVVTGMVTNNGAILEIGTISKNTVAAPALGQDVKKSGRTTGLSTSSIAGLNATVSVTYDDECAGGTAFTKTFTGQVIISNKGSKFLNAGDSGSLMVENVATNPRAVGLLYAGSSVSAVANPINEVLTFVGGRLGGTATMVGN